MKKMHETMMLFSSLLSSDVANDTICDDIGEKSKVVKPTTRWRPGRRTHYCKISQENQQAKRRRLSDEQVRFLEMRFEEEKKLESRRKLHLASESGLDPKQVSIWFQNRRARSKSKQLEDDYSKLKLEHQASILQKCRLQAEVLDLKQKLEEAEKKVQKGFSSVAAAGDVISSANTSANSLSVDTTHYCSTPFTGEEHDHVNFPDWANFYGM